jgi:sec-independent protein translocase protein TatA
LNNLTGANMLEDLGFEKILLILLVFFIFFGAKKIPEMAQGLGKGIREFKKALRDIPDDSNNGDLNNQNKS